MFIETPIIKGSTKQRRPIAGVGINDAPYITVYKDSNGKSIFCPYYLVWKAMIVRCFDKKLHERHPSYKGATLEESWKIFSNFKSWMQAQEWKGKQLDKDLLSFGNKHYGPDTCIFITQALNSLLTIRKSNRGAFPLGVSKVVKGKHTRYQAHCSLYGKQVNVGSFTTSEEAAEKYKEVKLKHIAELAEKETNPRIKEALLNLR